MPPLLASRPRNYRPTLYPQFFNYFLSDISPQLLQLQSQKLRPQDRSEITSLKQTADSGLQSGRALHTSKQPSTSPITPSPQALHPELVQVIEEFEDVSPAQLPLGLPPSRPTHHHIELEPGAKPQAHRIYRTSPPEEGELKKQLEVDLSAGQIEPARSHFGAGFLFSRNTDVTQRHCVDAKRQVPLPRIDEFLDSMVGLQLFRKINLAQGYHQIRVYPEHVTRTAFQTKFGSYKFKVMPFGLCNTPSTFHRTMNDILRPCSTFAQVYVDDIVIHSTSVEEYAEHLRSVLQLLHR